MSAVVAAPGNASWHQPAGLAREWLAYSLLHLATGPLIAAHEAADSGCSPQAAIAGVIARSWEISQVENISQPLLARAFGASPPQVAALAPVAWPCAAFHALQAAQASASWAFPALQALPTAYFARLKSNLEVELAAQHSAALDQSFADLLAEFVGSFALAQQVSGPAALAWAGCVRDGLIFSLFHLLKSANAAGASSHLAADFYIETVADEGMVLVSERPAHAIADYLIASREQALEAVFHAFPALEQLQGRLAQAASKLQQALPPPLHAALALALPSEKFLAAHAATDFLKELLTAVAVALPVAAAGIHLLPRMLDPEGLAFAMLKETATNVLIELAGRSALPLGDFLSEKAWLAIEGMQQLTSMAPWMHGPGDAELAAPGNAALVGVAETCSLH